MLKLKDPSLFSQRCYIDGAWSDADSGKTIAVTNPATGAVIGSIPDMGAGEAHLLNLCVREQFRFRGLGSQLLRYLLQQAVVAGARVMFLETRPSNQAAIRLYQSHHFVQIGVRRGYYQAAGGREDALVMRRTLI